MQLAIKKFINTPKHTQRLLTLAAIFFNLTNQFNSVSHQELFNVISEIFPELLPFTTLFYDTPNTVHHKWDDGTWQQFLMLEGVTQDASSHLSLHCLSLLDSLNQLVHHYVNAQQHI